MKQGRVLTGLLTVALAGGALVATAPAASAVPTPKSGTNVLVFNDPDFVDTIPLADVDPDNADHEGANMILALQSQGHTVSEVTGTSAATLTAALKGKHTFVIPELEESPWVTELSTDARSAIVTWIRGGGTLVVAADDRSTLNDLFGYRLETRWEDEGFEWIKTTPKGSAFAGSAAVLPANDGSVGVMTASLPSGAVAQYTSTDDGTDRTAGVVTFGQGRGTVVHLAWDWYDGQPAGYQDEGWNDILDTAVTIRPAAAAVVAPSNVFSVSAKAAANPRTGRAAFNVKVPGPGRIKVVGAKKGVVGSVSKTVSRKGTVRITLTPTAKTRKALQRQLKRKKVASVKVRVKTTYTPTNGKARTVTKTYVLKMTKPKKKR